MFKTNVFIRTRRDFVHLSSGLGMSAAIGSTSLRRVVVTLRVQTLRTRYEDMTRRRIRVIYYRRFRNGKKREPTEIVDPATREAER